MRQREMSPIYWEHVAQRGAELGTDGCTMATQLYRRYCVEHDIHYRTHRDLWGKSITKEEADQLFKYRIQQSSPFGWLSPMAMGRYLAVTWFGKSAWYSVIGKSSC